MVTLITGGIKSKKTSYGLFLGKSYTSKAYIATAEGFDEEMKHKIKMHQDERGNSWKTIEEPIEISNVLMALKEDFIMIDCITIWLNNLLYYKKECDHYVDTFCNILKSCNQEIVIVTNEIGLGVIPERKDVRDYVNRLGLINQKIGNIADTVIMMVSGIPLYIKGRGIDDQRNSKKDTAY